MGSPSSQINTVVAYSASEFGGSKKVKMLWLSGVTGVIDTGCQSAVGGRSFHGQQQSLRGGGGRTFFISMRVLSTVERGRDTK